VRQASLVKLTGESPGRAKVSRQPGTESRIANGNGCSEAGRMDVSDRNASEGIEPRNLIRRGSRLFQITGMQHLPARNGESREVPPGSESSV
jgi:hypothetical protein